jgi:REP element-mobilizing transposase RayT
MARKRRIHVSGGLYHVMLRGNGGQDIFSDGEDRSRFYFLVQEGIERYGHRIHAFCLMDNHIHLAIQVADTPLSRIMQNLSFRYTRWINCRQRKTGHLFQGRYKALLVDADSYLLELVRYIHLNPVRAGLVSDAADYEWSGHRAYQGHEVIPWLTTDWVLGQFGDSAGSARNQYSRFVLDALDEKRRNEFHQGGEDTRVLGDDHFLQLAMAQSNEPVQMKISLEEIISSVCKECHLDEEELCGPSRKRLFAEARAITGWLVTEIGQHTLAELAGRMNRDSSALSQLVKKIRVRVVEDAGFGQRLSQLKSDLNQ